MNVESSSKPTVEKVVCDDQITNWFVIACIAWGIIGMLAGGVWLALELAWWPANVSRYLTFGRLRPVHTDAVIFAFAGNAIFAAIYRSTQRPVVAGVQDAMVQGDDTMASLRETDPGRHARRMPAWGVEAT